MTDMIMPTHRVRIRVAHCWAHARRKLKEVFDRDGSEIAAEGLRRIAEFYAVEADIRGIDPGQRRSARQARTAPLVAAFGDWLQDQRLRVSAKSRLGEKLAYIHRHWDGLQTFLHDGRVEIDSNPVENLVRPIALNRKNALFAGHDEGGKAWGRIASLIETAKVNSVDRIRPILDREMDTLAENYGTKYEKAVTCMTKDYEARSPSTTFPPNTLMTAALARHEWFRSLKGQKDPSWTLPTTIFA